jgi:3-oxoacyl-[acyl-carrier-protein] synthase III
LNVTLPGITLSAIATALPKNELKASDLYTRFKKKTIDRIVFSTGIEALRVAPETMHASDLCQHAAEHLFVNGAVKREDIDGIVFVSQTPDCIMPATSSLLQGKLGLGKNTVAFDINHGCMGYLYGLYQAALLVSSKSCKKVLLCTGDTITQHIDPDNPKLRTVLGDAGAASVIESGEDAWFFDIHTDGTRYDQLMIPNLPDRTPGHLQMDGEKIMAFALTEVPKSIHTVLNAKSWHKDELQHAILHQANAFMLNYLRKQMNLSTQQVPIAVKTYGNTGPASIPLTLCDLFWSQPNMLGKTIFSGFGVGLSWGSLGLNLDGVSLFKPINL